MLHPYHSTGSPVSLVQLTMFCFLPLALIVLLLFYLLFVSLLRNNHGQNRHRPTTELKPSKTDDLPPASQSTPINAHINQLRRSGERSYNNTAINRARERVAGSRQEHTEEAKHLLCVCEGTSNFARERRRLSIRNPTKAVGGD